MLKAVLSRFDVGDGADGLELSRRRAITMSPSRRASTVLHDRPQVRTNGRPAETVTTPVAAA